jgi:hypothetical protein
VTYKAKKNRVYGGAKYSMTKQHVKL